MSSKMVAGIVRLLDTWMLGNIQRIIRIPHCANLMHSDLECRRSTGFTDPRLRPGGGYGIPGRVRSPHVPRPRRRRPNTRDPPPAEPDLRAGRYGRRGVLHPTPRHNSRYASSELSRLMRPRKITTYGS